jgi:hypothetical protein
MPAAIPIVAAVAGSATSAIGNKLSQPKVEQGKPFDPRLPTQSMDLFTQTGMGDQARSAFGQQLMRALSGSLAKFGGGPMPDFNFGAAPNFQPLGAPPQQGAPQSAPGPPLRGLAAQSAQALPQSGSVGNLLRRFEEEA